MMSKRVMEGIVRPAGIEIQVDNTVIATFPGETLAAAMMAADVRKFYNTKSGAPREAFCNMGVCYECTVMLVRDDGASGSMRREWVRACMTKVEPGMRVRTGRWMSCDDA
ncbi:MAG: (2Fe-2S)-binding protein [Parvularculaceae bacterium]|nr:(2Fe-2S)-binding protein [Parvularculaceae bacterium]